MGGFKKLLGLGKKKKAPPAPVVEKPPVMVDEEALANAEKMALKKRQASRGRASTILTDRSSDRLGGGM